MIRWSIRFLWYDLWIGVYRDTKGGAWYVCPLPCVVLKLWWEPKLTGQREGGEGEHMTVDEALQDVRQFRGQDRVSLIDRSVALVLVAEIDRLRAELAEWRKAFEAYHALGLAADYAQLKHLYDAQKGGGG